MNVLWAPWRMQVIAAAKPPGCFLCDSPRLRQRRQSLVLATTRSSFVILNRYPYANAHLLVAPRRHCADLEALGAEARQDLSETLSRSIAALRRAVEPQGVNVGLNLGIAAGAGVADHLHWHVIPRWTGDVNFMPLLGETKVMPQHLDETWEILRPEFEKLEKPGKPRDDRQARTPHAPVKT